MYKKLLVLNQSWLFCTIACSPKAIVQAAIGAITLSLGLASGQIILAAAVTAILLTAPMSAFLIDKLTKSYLESFNKVFRRLFINKK